MKRIQIFKNSVLTNHAEFSTDELLNAWFEKEKQNKSFGKNERTYLVANESELPKNENLSDVILIEDIDTAEGPKKRYTFKADYAFIITDITEENNDRFKIRKSSEARSIGQSILDEVALINIKKNKTKQELKQFLNNNAIKEIILMLQVGLLTNAKDEILTLPEQFFTLDEKNLIISKIDKFINSFIP